MIDYAKKKPGELIIATGMVGTYLYLEAELMKRVANINITTLPLPGVMDAITTLLGGHSDLAMSSDVAVRSYISTGKMRGLACDIKSILFPDIPTFIEKGFTKIDLVPILAILGPKGMPREVVEVWGKALKAVANDPKRVSEFNKLGLNVDFRTQDLSTMFKKEVEKYSRFTPEELGWK
jgi:tripartite-type tricarboxylate transporter receptor subunit TctC